MGKELGGMESSTVSIYPGGVEDRALVRLIKDIICARAPDLVDVIARIGSEAIPHSDAERVREILADELVENGLGPDDEPDERGRLVELAIDFVGKASLRDRTKAS